MESIRKAYSEPTLEKRQQLLEITEGDAINVTTTGGGGEEEVGGPY